MNAMDVMVSPVITIKPDDTVAKAVDLFAKHDISALPVVDGNNAVVGIVSEADLVHREEIGTEVQRAWWLEAVTPASTLAKEFAKSHGRRIDEVMSTRVVSASEDTPLAEIATLLERHRIKRVPILRTGKLVGIVSRANLIQALASAQNATNANTSTSANDDRAIRLDVLDRLVGKPWTQFGERNVIVRDGVVHLWGLVSSEAERKALTALAEEVPRVVRVSDEMIPSY
jgi:CBS domain-containing protein